MTLQEVEDILGPERDETDGTAIALLPPSPKWNPRTTLDRQWITKRTVITIGVDRNTGRVVDKWLEQSFPTDPSDWETEKGGRPSP
jgi:hypothetical protein